MQRCVRGLAPLVLMALTLPLVGCAAHQEPAVTDSSSSSASPSASPSASSSAWATDEVRPYEPLAGIFGPGSEWRRDVSEAPLSADSAALVANLTNQVATRYGGVAAFNDSQYNNSFFQVPADTPRTDVTFDDCQGKGSTPPQLYQQASGAHFRDVPIPASARPARGTDAGLSLYSPSTDQLWELWKARRTGDTWSACWGGRLDHVSTSKGFFPDGMGASASGLAVSGGSIGIVEARRGRIEHALSLAVPDVASYTTHSYPAQRSDGRLPLGTPSAILAGQRLRLDPSLDVDSLPLTPIARMVAEAAQRYGFIVTDTSGAVAVTPESGEGVRRLTGTDPWKGLEQGVASYEIMRGFPWDRLQALPVDYGQSAN